MTVGGSQVGKVAFGGVGVALRGTSQRRFQGVLVSQARQTAVLANQVDVHGLHDQPVDPAWLLHHGLLGQLSQRVAVLARHLGGDLQRLLGHGVIGR